MTIECRPRSDQERSDVNDILRRAEIGFLAVAGRAPYVVPINFAYDTSESPEGWGRLLFHSGEGAKSRVLKDDPRVCLAVLESSTFQRGSLPCDDGFAYRSVLIEGTATLLQGRAKRLRALRLIVEKYDPGHADTPVDEQMFERTLVYSVAVASVGFKERPLRT